MIAVLRKVWPFLFIVLLQGCASIQSGHYVQVTRNENLSSLSTKYSIPEILLLKHNRGKDFTPGDWVFIPQEIGLVELFQTEIPYYKGKVSGVYTGEFLWPVPAFTRISSFYGKRGKKNHDGIDIPAPKGKHIVAIEDGVVSYSGNKIRGYGNLTIIRHKGKFHSVYAHAKKNFTKKGQKVYKGQVIALVGNTGRSTGPHLHFEIRHKGRSKNPMSYYRKSKGRQIASLKKEE